MGRLGLSFAAAMMFVGCGAASQPAQPGGVELGEAVAPADAEWWKRGECPAGTTLEQEWGDHSGEVWCATARGVRHGPFARWSDGDTNQAHVEGLYARGVEHGVWRHSTKEGVKTTTYDHGRFIATRQVLREASHYCDPVADYVLYASEAGMYSVCELPGAVRNGMYRAKIGGFTIEGEYDHGVPVGEWTYSSGDRSTTVQHDTGERVDFVYVGDRHWSHCPIVPDSSPRTDELCALDLPGLP